MVMEKHVKFRRRFIPVNVNGRIVYRRDRNTYEVMNIYFSDNLQHNRLLPFFSLLNLDDIFSGPIQFPITHPLETLIIV
jgi:hypothetical protein